MFKKFKDKLAEEMKQSPARLQASMQQLAQAVVSPAQSNSSIQEMPVSNDIGSLYKDTDDFAKGSSTKNTFQNVELMPPPSNSTEMSRRSSVSSIISDVTSLFPTYESPKNLYQLQSDVEQSATEIDDNIGPQLDRVTKDQLYLAYRKVHTKYQKYRGRCTDLATHYRELERVKTKLESILVETQDNVLRRIGDLKEQCQLEQQAKAHLEEVLRNDIEEKNHIIDTLNTKIKLLQGNVSNSENLMLLDTEEGHNSTIEVLEPKKETSDSANENSELQTENAQLKNKLIKIETILLKYKDSLKRCKDRLNEVTEEKNVLKRDYDALKSSSLENAEILQQELSTSRKEVQDLSEQVNILKKREEESVISLAENKLSIHRELEGKEEQIKQLQVDLKQAIESKENLSKNIEKYKAEVEQLKVQCNTYKFNTDKSNNTQKISKEHIEEQENSALKKDNKLNDNELIEKLKYDLTEKESELQNLKIILEESEELCKVYQRDTEKVQNELSNLKFKYTELKKEHDAQTIITDENRKEAEMTIEKLQMTVQNLDKELENMRNALLDRDQVCETYNLKLQEYVTLLETANQKLTIQDAEMKRLKDQLPNENEINQLRIELEKKDAVLSELRNDLQTRENTISNLKKEIQMNISKIESFDKEKVLFATKILYYKKFIGELKQNCIYLKNDVNETFLDQTTTISNLKNMMNVYLQSMEKDKKHLEKKVERLQIELNTLESSKVKQLESELADAKREKTTLQSELKEYKTKLDETATKAKQSQESNLKINKLIAEIDNLNFKIHNLERREESLIEIKENDVKHKERLTNELNELTTKHEEAIKTIRMLENEKAKYIEPQKQLELLKSEIEDLKANEMKNNHEIKELNEKILNKESEIMNFKTKYEEYAKLIEECNEKNAELNEKYQQALKEHEEITLQLNNSNSTLQETINTKNSQLKKLKIIKEQQNKMIQEVTEELDKYKIENTNISEMIQTLSKQLETLQNENHQLETLKTQNLLLTSELDELRSSRDEIVQKNKSLYAKQSELIESNQNLIEVENKSQTKILNYEKNMEDLLSNIKLLEHDIESYKNKLNIQNEEIESLQHQLTKTKEDVIFKNATIDSLHEQLTRQNEEILKLNQELSKQSEDLSSKSNQLNTLLKNFKSTEKDRDTLFNTVKELEHQLTHVNTIRKKENESINDNKKLINLQLEQLSNFEAENKRLAAELTNMEEKIDEKESKLSSLEKMKENLLSENEQLKSSHLEELQKKNEEIIFLQDEVKTLKQSTVELKLQVDSLNDLKHKFRNEVEADNKIVEDGLVEKSNKLQEENKKLEAQLDEALITFQAKESQMQMINSELRNQTDQLKEELKVHEQEQNIRLKQLVKEFQAQLQDKEEELQSALEKRFDYQQNYESNLLQQYKEQLKDFQAELTVKSEQLENLILENKKLLVDKEKEIDSLTETITRIKKEHINELREIEQKWKIILQQRSDKLEAKHEEEIKELTREWRNERKPDIQIDTSPGELENTSCIAMAAIQSNTGSFHTFQQTLASQSRELAELRKLVKLRHDTLEDSTEIEYLRNILYEYMMGRETMVLAKVIAAVVKFDQEQTARILKKEEDKLTLLGSLGLT